MWSNLFGCQCGAPENVRMSQAERPFTLTLLLHSADLDAVDGGAGLVASQRPTVCVHAGSAEPVETGLGEWCAEKGQWRFQETVTLRLLAADVIRLTISVTTTLPLVGSAALPARAIGEVELSVAELLPRLRLRDTAGSGPIHATPVFGMELLQSGQRTGKLYVSMETKTPPAALRRDVGDSTLNATENTSVIGGAHWDGATKWKHTGTKSGKADALGSTTGIGLIMGC